MRPSIQTDTVFLHPQVAKDANKLCFAGPVYTLWKFHSHSKFCLVLSLIMNINNFVFCTE